ncbi:hypothetical protein J2X21_003641 [Kinneretia asaccharophila]|uniref:Uncharacterized protein n=1 Tax=Roseateles asaccharophilus TaxID=582607 RepID=A0ABU2ABA9_9BURK|nr:hypothetical protein [Roseateles asaccharophilus]
MVVTLRQPESDTDTRQAYDDAIIRLALDKTLATHGPYRVESAPAMNIQRALVSVEQLRYPNVLVVSSPDPARAAAGLVPVRFPLQMGAVGHRVCSVSPQVQAAVAQARTLAELRRFRRLADNRGQWKSVPAPSPSCSSPTPSPRPPRPRRWTPRCRSTRWPRSPSPPAFPAGPSGRASSSTSR